MVYAITCFHGRHSLVERVMGFFINQEYEDQTTLLLYNNSKVKQQLDYESLKDLPENKNIILINNHIDSETKEEYTNTGAIFRDAMTHVPNLSVVTFFDSDDVFFPTHLKKGIEGLNKAIQISSKYIAYKPYFSYYIGPENNVELSHNNMEPSIFVKSWWVKTQGFHQVASSYHQKWKDILDREGRIFVDRDGEPTFLYDWHKNHGTHKISGLGDSKDNFKAHREYEVDHGDSVLTPIFVELKLNTNV